QRMTEGESLGVLEWLPGRGGYATAVNVIDPERLSNPHGKAESQTMRSGVELDPAGAVLAYHIQIGHPQDYTLTTNAYRWERVERTLPHGRPRVLHHFEPQRAGQHRGVSELAAVLERARMVERYERAELQSALIGATFAAFIESPYDPDMVEAALGGGQVAPYQAGRSAFHKEREISLDGARIPTLYPGEKVSQLAGAHPHSAFEAFTQSALGSVAAALGLSREELTGDYSGANYSALRGAFLKSWKSLTARRDAFAEHIATPIYLAWLEEAMDRGDVEIPPGAPDLWDAPYAWSRCAWLGPARGWVDPTKEAQAAEIRMRAGLSTLQQEAAEQGRDWEETLEQRAAERTMARELGLDVEAVAERIRTEPQAPTQPDDEDARDVAGRAG
ncbi:MAG: phage portal protein, partial [Pseudomonadota bacterium]